MPDRGVTPAPVVTVLDPRRHVTDRTGPGRPHPAVVELRFQGREETFCHGVIPANTGQSHRPDDAVFGGKLGDLGRGVLGAAVGVEDHRSGPACLLYTS